MTSRFEVRPTEGPLAADIFGFRGRGYLYGDPPGATREDEPRDDV